MQRIHPTSGAACCELSIESCEKEDVPQKVYLEIDSWKIVNGKWFCRQEEAQQQQYSEALFSLDEIRAANIRIQPTEFTWILVSEIVKWSEKKKELEAVTEWHRSSTLLQFIEMSKMIDDTTSASESNAVLDDYVKAWLNHDNSSTDHDLPANDDSKSEQPDREFSDRDLAALSLLHIRNDLFTRIDTDLRQMDRLQEMESTIKAKEDFDVLNKLMQNQQSGQNQLPASNKRNLQKAKSSKSKLKIYMRNLFSCVKSLDFAGKYGDYFRQVNHVLKMLGRELLSLIFDESLIKSNKQKLLWSPGPCGNTLIHTCFLHGVGDFVFDQLTSLSEKLKKHLEKDVTSESEIEDNCPILMYDVKDRKLFLNGNSNSESLKLKNDPELEVTSKELDHRREVLLSDIRTILNQTYQDDISLWVKKVVKGGDFIESDGGLYTGETCLHIAIVQQDLVLVQKLIRMGVDLNARACGIFFKPKLQNRTNLKKNAVRKYSLESNEYSGCYYGEFPFSFAASIGNKDICSMIFEKYLTKFAEGPSRSKVMPLSAP